METNSNATFHIFPGFYAKKPMIKFYNIQYPALAGMFSKKTTCRTRTINQAKDIPVVLPSSPIKMWDKLIHGFWVHAPMMKYIQSLKYKNEKNRVNFSQRHKK